MNVKNTKLDKFLITNLQFYKNIDESIFYASSIGVSKIYLRDFDFNKKILTNIIESCKRYNISLFFNYKEDFLNYINNKTIGIHLKGNQLHLIDKISNTLVSYSAHNIQDVIKAYNLGVDFIFLSPIFFVENKAKPLGIEYLRNIPDIYKDKIYALGGINNSNIDILETSGIKGLAGIRMFLQRKLKEN